jgi:CRP/FNR family transcriptional regulator, cyclic AMP receptor protein
VNAPLYAFPVTKVPVLNVDPDLGAGIPEPRRSAAVRACAAEVLDLPLGAWSAEELPGGREGLGLLVLSGVLCRRVVQGASYGAELLGPGDLLRPWDRVGEWSSIPTESSWTVIQQTRLAILDRRFAHQASDHPEIAAELLRRGLMRPRYLTILIAIVSQRRIETRLTMLFWHLADRFGQRRSDWVHIPVPLTHRVLAELVAARRPTVTTALSGLQERGILLREPEGWLLSATAPVEPGAAPLPLPARAPSRESA